MTLETPQTALLNLAPMYLEYGHICHKSAKFFKVWGFHQTQAGFCHPSAAKPTKKHASLKKWPTVRKWQKNHQKLKKWSKMKNIFEKIRNFSVLDESDCQAAWLFCTLGPIWSQNMRLARCGRSTPFPHAYRENWPTFRSMGLPSNPSWIMCRRTLQDH